MEGQLIEAKRVVTLCFVGLLLATAVGSMGRLVSGMSSMEPFVLTSENLSCTISSPLVHSVGCLHAYGSAGRIWLPPPFKDVQIATRALSSPCREDGGHPRAHCSCFSTSLRPLRAGIPT